MLAFIMCSVEGVYKPDALSRICKKMESDGIFVEKENFSYRLVDAYPVDGVYDIILRVEGEAEDSSYYRELLKDFRNELGSYMSYNYGKTMSTVTLQII